MREKRKRKRGERERDEKERTKRKIKRVAKRCFQRGSLRKMITDRQTDR